MAIKLGEAGVTGTTGGESTMSRVRKAGGLTEGSGKMGTVRWLVGLLSRLG